MTAPVINLSPHAQAVAIPARGPTSIELLDQGFASLTPPSPDTHDVPACDTEEELEFWKNAPSVRIKGFTASRFVDFRAVEMGTATLELSAYDACQVRDFLCCHFGPPTSTPQEDTK